MYYGRRRFLRDAPPDPTAGANGGGGGSEGGSSSGGTPPAPAPFDPNALSPEVKAYIEAQRAEERNKARNFDKAKAAKDAREELLRQLGGGDGTKTPEQIADELRQAQSATAEKDAKINALMTERAVDRACRATDINADGELVAAVLASRGKLAGLDPTAADFDTKVKALVKEAVDANPRLKLGAVATPPPAGGSGPGAGHHVPGGGERPARPTSIADALARRDAARAAS